MSATPHAPRLLFFAGSARTGSHNMRLAKLGATIAEANGIAATFADLGDYPLPLYDQDLQTAEGIPENARKFEALMRVHTGIFIACPEYNASITPLLKNTLDWLSRIRNDGEEPLAVFKTRVFALGSSSPGEWAACAALTRRGRCWNSGSARWCCRNSLRCRGRWKPMTNTAI